MAGLNARELRWLTVLSVLYGAVVVAVGAHKGNDLVYELHQSERWLAGQPLYDEPPAQGMWWPPFSTALVAPFALLARTSLTTAKAIWAALGVVALVISVVLARRWGGWRPVLLGLAAIAMPLQSNFEHLNINTVLLALALGAAADLADGRDARAGTWIGVATAIKAFPGLVLVGFALTGRWRALAAGAAVAAGLTYVAMLPYGPVDAAEALWNWLRLSATARSYAGAEVAALGMQKIGRLTAALGGGIAAAAAANLVLLGVVAVSLRRHARAQGPLWEVGLVVITALLIAPIGWLHSFTLAFPAWVAAIGGRPALGGTAARAWTTALVGAGILTSGMLAHIPFGGSLAFVPKHNDTVGSLLLVALLVLTPFIGAASPPDPLSAVRRGGTAIRGDGGSV